MEVNYRPVNINSPIITTKSENNKETEKELITTETSSDNALNTYGQAILGIKNETGEKLAALARVSTPPCEYKKLTDEDYEEYKKLIKEKADWIPKEASKHFDFNYLTKDNIFIFDKALSDEKIYGNEDRLEVALNAISSLQYDGTNAESKNKLAEKLLYDENLYSNPAVRTDTAYILSAATTPSRFEFIDKMLSDKTLCNEIFLKVNLQDAIAFIPDKAVDAMNNFTDKIIADPERFLNDKLRENILYAYKYIPEKLNVVSELIDKGAGFSEAYATVHDESKYNELKENLENPTSLRKLFMSGEYDSKITKATQGKYQKNLAEIFNKDIMPYENINKLCSELSEQDFLSGIKKISTSTYKLAMKTPNQYLSDIDKKYTAKVNGKYPKLSEEELAEQQAKVTEFFKNNAGKMLRALKYIDTDTLNQAADKRTALFEKSLNDMDELTNDNYKLLSSLIKCKNGENGKPLTAKDKTELCRIVQIFQKANINTSTLTAQAETGEINIPDIKETIQKEVIRRAGISDELLNNVPKDKLKFNEEYSYLALMSGSIHDLIGEITDAENTELLFTMQMSMMRDMSPEDLKTATTNMRNNVKEQKLPEDLLDANLELIDMYRNIDKYGDDEIWEKYKEVTDLLIEYNSNAEVLFTVIRESISGDFEAFITSPDNVYGQTNEKTKEAFENAGLDYEQWNAPDITDNSFEINGNKMTVKLWDRNPQEDLFLGNKTTCCTAIGTGINQSAQPIFLLNKAFNVAELYDENGNTVGMSRAFTGKVNGENALLADNIELNNTFVKNLSDEDKLEIRNQIFDYLNKYAKAVNGGKDMPVYFYSGDVHVPTDDLEKISSVTEFTGKISQKKVYINSASCTWVNPDRLQDKGEIEWLKVPKSDMAA